MKTHPRRSLFVLACLAALGVGWMAGTTRPLALGAGTADRWNDRVVLTGPISLELNKQGSPVPVDALYVLNYSNGLLLAAVPAFEQSTNSLKAFTDFAERDLVKDFAIAPGTRPHFLMTTMSRGVRGDGWAPLIVIETETGQIGTYRVLPQFAPGSTRPTFQLVDRRTDTRLARSLSAAEPSR